MFRKLAGACVSLTLLCVPMITFAHATPTTYLPAASETVLQTPEFISIEFTERIEPNASSISVYGPSGNTVSDGKGTIDVQNERTISVPIHSEGEGVYTVSWQVVSVDDGHFTKGGYSFLVNSEGIAYEGEEETVSVAYSASVEDASASFLNLLGESIFIALFFLFLGSQRFQRISVPAKFYVHVSLLALILFCFGAIISILKKTYELAQLQSISFTDAVLVYGSSMVGMAGIIKTILACVFVGIFLYTLARPSSARYGILAVLLCAILYVQSFISHAAASLFMPHLSIGVTLIHLFTKEFAVGGLLVLCTLFFVYLQQKKLAQYIPIARLYDIFSSLALLFAAGSGAYVTWLHLKTASYLFLTAWGELFVVLLSFTLILGVLRLFHLCVVHVRWDKAILRNIYAVTLPVEMTIALCVLFYSGYISMTTPPFTVEAYTFTESVFSEGVETMIQIHPYESSMFLLTFKDTDSNTLIEPRALTIFAEQTDLGIGPNVLSSYKRYDGAYVFPRTELSPHGMWKTHVTASFEGRYDAQSEFSLNYPDAVDATRYSNEVRTWDSFATVMLCIAGGAVVFFGALTLWALRTWKKTSALSTSYSLTYTWRSALLSLCSIALVLGSAYMILPSSFEKLCLKEGFVWEMGYPARDFETTSKNAYLGCTVHGGHYHFVDEREFHTYLMSLE